MSRLLRIPQMVIKASSAAEVRALVAALGGVDEVQLDAAIARLGVIGARAIERLTDAYAAATSRETQLAILRALEVIGDPRSTPLARRALAEGGDVWLNGGMWNDNPPAIAVVTTTPGSCNRVFASVDVLKV